MSQRKLPLWLILILVAPLVIIGCLNLLAPRISEETVFFPQPRPSRATTQAQLDQNWLANAQATNWKTPMTISQPSLTITRLTPKSVGATFIAQDTRHGFAVYGQDKLAWSLTTRAISAQDTSRPLIVTCSGNAMDRYSAGVSYAQKALPWGDVLLFDYPGYGDSTGKPSPQAFEAAIKAMIAHARSVAGQRKIVFWGHSLGGFVCGKMASLVPETHALILETTARRAKDVVREWTPPMMRPFVFPKISASFAAYDTAQAVGAAKFPVLVLGAGQDDTLPVPLARALAEALKQQGAVVSYHEFPQALHWNVPNQTDYRAVMTTFFETLRPQQ